MCDSEQIICLMLLSVGGIPVFVQAVQWDTHLAYHKLERLFRVQKYSSKFLGPISWNEILGNWAIGQIWYAMRTITQLT